MYKLKYKVNNQFTNYIFDVQVESKTKNNYILKKKQSYIVPSLQVKTDHDKWDHTMRILNFYHYIYWRMNY